VIGDFLQEVKVEDVAYRILGRAKEPLERAGFGFMGVMLASLDGQKVMCHECGRMLKWLNHEHLGERHGIDQREYRTKYSLLTRRALASPAHSEGARQRELKRAVGGWRVIPIANLKRHRPRPEVRAAAVTASKRSREAQNARGTCEDQLRARFITTAREMNVPPERLFWKDCPMRLRGVVTDRYGTWNRAKRILLGAEATVGLGKYRDPVSRIKWTEEKIVGATKSWIERNGRNPYAVDFLNDKSLPHYRALQREFGGLNGLRKRMGLPRIEPGYNIPMRYRMYQMAHAGLTTKEKIVMAVIKRRR